MSTRLEFLNAEVISLRESIRARIYLAESNIKYLLIFSGASWAWIFSENNLNEKYRIFAFFLPSVISFFL